MIYIIVALKAEAQAFVDKYKLKNYKNDKISIIISGIGKENMYNSTCQVLKNLKSKDKIANIGICGANKKYAVGEIIDGMKKKITCVDYEVKDEIFEIADMESGGFLEALKDIKNKYIFKVVSDNFKPKTVTKDMAKKLIFDNIDEIMRRIEK